MKGGKIMYKTLASALGLGAVASYPVWKSKTEIIYQKTPENEKILELCRQHLRKYLPSYHLFPHGAF